MSCVLKTLVFQMILVLHCPLAQSKRGVPILQFDSNHLVAKNSQFHSDMCIACISKFQCIRKKSRVILALPNSVSYSLNLNLLLETGGVFVSQKCQFIILLIFPPKLSQNTRHFSFHVNRLRDERQGAYKEDLFNGKRVEMENLLVISKVKWTDNCITQQYFY